MTVADRTPREPLARPAGGDSWRDAQGTAPRRLAGSIGFSAALHVAAIAGLLLHRPPPKPASPPIYRVDLVAAPPGPPAIGAVTPEPAPAGEPTPAAPTPPPKVETPPKAAAPAPAPPRPETRPRAMPLPTPAKTKPAPPVATPVPPSKTKPATEAKPATTKPTPAPPAKPILTPAKPTTPPKPATTAKPGEAAGKPGASGPVGPRAAGGAEGGRGADVANVHVAGLEFPYPGYLQNIVRQVRLRFTPDKGRMLQADVAFLIHRDGSVSDIRIMRKSGDYGFDLEARGAIESSGRSGAFGALPDGFNADVLPVTFSFDPSVIR